MMTTAQKLATRERAKGWREVADSLYARAVFAEIVQPMLDRPLTEIARELNTMHVPKVRGVDRWTAPDVTRLLARVAAMADATNTAAWEVQFKRFVRDLGAD